MMSAPNLEAVIFDVDGTFAGQLAAWLHPVPLSSPTCAMRAIPMLKKHGTYQYE